MSGDDFETNPVGTAEKLKKAESNLLTCQADTAYFKHRVKMIIPVFQEARDALTALTMTQVQIRGISLTLADRMDDVGTYNREKYDAEQAALKGGKR